MTKKEILLLLFKNIYLYVFSSSEHIFNFLLLRFSVEKLIIFIASVVIIRYIEH